MPCTGPDRSLNRAYSFFRLVLSIDSEPKYGLTSTSQLSRYFNTACEGIVGCYVCSFVREL
jgi:hypothetical protein